MGFKRIRVVVVALAAVALSVGVALPAQAHGSDHGGGVCSGSESAPGYGSASPLECLTSGVVAPEGCNEDGLKALGLDPAVSGVVHFVEYPVWFTGLSPTVHYLNCTQVVPWEDSIDYQAGAWWTAVGLEQWWGALWANICAFGIYCA